MIEEQEVRKAIWFIVRRTGQRMIEEVSKYSGRSDRSRLTQKAPLQSQNQSQKAQRILRGVSTAPLRFTKGEPPLGCTSL